MMQNRQTVRNFVTGALALGSLFAAIGTAAAGTRWMLQHRKDPAASVVQIACGSSRGSGFFVKARDGHVYVATALHVIDQGGAITITRLDGPSDHRYRTAWDEVTVVAMDPRLDLALLEVRNVPAEQTPALTLAQARPATNAPVTVYGFPASRNERTGTLTSLPMQSGTVLNPASRTDHYDQLTQRVVEIGAIPVMLISNQVAPGNSGGPVVDADGRVAGVVIRKDPSNNSAVAVSHEALASLLPARAPAPITAERVQERLRHLLADELASNEPAQHDSWVDRDDLPQLRGVAGDISVRIRTAGRDASSDERAAELAQRDPFIDLYLTLVEDHALRHPWRPELRREVAQCARRDPAPLARPRDLAEDRCTNLLLRPLARDLLRSALHAPEDNSDPALTVTNLAPFDAENGLYRATVRVRNEAPFPVMVRDAHGQVFVRLFVEDTPSHVALRSALSPRQLAGRYVRSVNVNLPSGGQIGFQQRLTITNVADQGLSAELSVAGETLAPPRRVWSCNHSSRVRFGLGQQFGGPVMFGKGLLVGAQAHYTGWPSGCDGLTYSPDFAWVLRAGNNGELDATVIGRNGEVERYALTPER